MFISILMMTAALADPTSAPDVRDVLAQEGYATDELTEVLGGVYVKSTEADSVKVWRGKSPLEVLELKDITEYNLDSWIASDSLKEMSLFQGVDWTKELHVLSYMDGEEPVNLVVVGGGVTQGEASYQTSIYDVAYIGEEWEVTIVSQEQGVSYLYDYIWFETDCGADGTLDVRADDYTSVQTSGLDNMLVIKYGMAVSVECVGQTKSSKK